MPGCAGSYGITAGHTPNVSQLMPGVVEIFENRAEEATEKYFVAGGYAFYLPDGSLKIAATEACKLDDLDALSQHFFRFVGSCLWFLSILPFRDDSLQLK